MYVSSRLFDEEELLIIEDALGREMPKGKTIKLAKREVELFLDAIKLISINEAKTDKSKKENHKVFAIRAASALLRQDSKSKRAEETVADRASLIAGASAVFIIDPRVGMKLIRILK